MEKYTSVLAQMLQMIPRYDFQKAVKLFGTERHSKGFSSWGHFVALLFGQLAGQDGLRGVEAGMATQETHLYHLGVRSVRRSTPRRLQKRTDGRSSSPSSTRRRAS